jgi:hypothetical protein
MQIVMTDTDFPHESSSESRPEPQPSSSSLSEHDNQRTDSHAERHPRPSTPDPHMEIFNRLHAGDGVHYLGDSNLEELAEFQIGGQEGNILVLKGLEPTYTEVSVTGIIYIYPFKLTMIQ